MTNWGFEVAPKQQQSRPVVDPGDGGKSRDCVASLRACRVWKPQVVASRAVEMELQEGCSVEELSAIFRFRRWKRLREPTDSTAWSGYTEEAMGRGTVVAPHDGFLAALNAVQRAAAEKSLSSAAQPPSGQGAVSHLYRITEYLVASPATFSPPLLRLVGTLVAQYLPLMPPSSSGNGVRRHRIGGHDEQDDDGHLDDYFAAAPTTSFASYFGTLAFNRWLRYRDGDGVTARGLGSRQELDADDLTNSIFQAEEYFWTDAAAWCHALEHVMDDGNSIGQQLAPVQLATLQQTISCAFRHQLSVRTQTRDHQRVDDDEVEEDGDFTQQECITFGLLSNTSQHRRELSCQDGGADDGLKHATPSAQLQQFVCGPLALSNFLVPLLLHLSPEVMEGGVGHSIHGHIAARFCGAHAPMTSHASSSQHFPPSLLTHQATLFDALLHSTFLVVD